MTRLHQPFKMSYSVIVAAHANLTMRFDERATQRNWLLPSAATSTFPFPKTIIARWSVSTFHPISATALKYTRIPHTIIPSVIYHFSSSSRLPLLYRHTHTHTHSFSLHPMLPIHVLFTYTHLLSDAGTAGKKVRVTRLFLTVIPPVNPLITYII